MRIDLYVDNMRYTCDTRDPELLGKWLVEQFSLIHWTPATDVRAQAWPSFNQMEQVADWSMDGRTLAEMYRVKTPREFVDALSKMLDQIELDKH